MSVEYVSQKATSQLLHFVIFCAAVVVIGFIAHAVTETEWWQNRKARKVCEVHERDFENEYKSLYGK